MLLYCDLLQLAFSKLEIKKRPASLRFLVTMWTFDQKLHEKNDLDII